MRPSETSAGDGDKAMLKELMEAWRGRDLLTRMLGEFEEMLVEAEWMYRTAWGVVYYEVAPKQVEAEIYARDKKVNRMQRRVRRQIIEHLTLRPEANLAACLVLMSVVKDAERIGDYCKNIFQVTDMCTRGFEHGTYIDPLRHILSEIKGVFGRAREAFATADVHLAEQVMATCRSLTKRCDLLISQLIRDTVPTEQAVAYTLLSRHFKRVASHLTNIASAVVSPVHLIDFVDDSLRDELRGGV